MESAGMAGKSPTPSQHTIAQAKLLYDAGVAPVAEVMRLLGMTASQFRSFREREGWPMRASPIRRRAAETPATSETPERAPTRDLIARLEEAVEREFANAEAALARSGPKSVEASARVLASLVRSLAELKRMRRDVGPVDGETREDDERATHESFDAPPRELAELRAELARRLERLRGEGEIG
jgi:hypothetical protein